MRSRLRRIEYPIALLLVALAAVPLIGAAFYSVAEVQDARVAKERANAVEAETTRLVLLTELQTRLLDERNWFSAVGGISQLGLTLDFVEGLTGLDVNGELEIAVTRVDELLAELKLADIETELLRIRAGSGRNLSDVGLQYSELEAAISVISDNTLDRLLTTAGVASGSDSLVNSLLVLDATATARQAISEEFTAFFSAQFSPTDVNTAEQLIRLTTQRSIRIEAEKEVQRLSKSGSEAAAATLSIQRSPAALRFNDAVTELISSRLTPEGAGQDNSLTLILDDIGEVAAVFRSSSDATALYFDLVDSSGADVKAASEAMAARADRERSEALGAILALATFVLAFTALAIGAIGQPARRLAETARRISDGDSSARFSGSGGSTEIGAAGRAINEAAANLQLAERQATALAEGDLDHPALENAPSGQLGASLQAAVASLATSLQDREEFRRRITHEATHDGLTQLANRNASMAQLERGISRSRRAESLLAVLFLDLDGFKAVNDNHGHHAGDIVLRTCAQRLVNSIRDGDHVGRLGGDEFLVIAESVAGASEAIHLAQRLLAAIAEPVQIDRKKVSIDGSIGIALSKADTDLSAEELLRDADLAVYKAKANGRGGIEVCDDELRSMVEERADLERALAQALENDEFELHYQPVIKPHSDEIDGVEALIRWNRPGHGMVYPDGFIPFAERSGLIIDIDRWVIGAAVRQLREWEDAGVREGISVAVNISSRHLSSGTFVEDIFNPLLDFRIRPERLIVEVTESALLDDIDLAATKLQTLRNRGIRTAIDDFGTGYTSLAHLKSLPIDILKIDRSFTNDETAGSLVKLIIDIGHLLGAKITAEGIETTQQAQHLTQLGTDDLQGYLYSKPIPPEQIATFEVPEILAAPVLAPVETDVILTDH